MNDGDVMKILFFTDTHIRGTTPKNRLDDFTETLEKKLYEVVSIVENNKVDFVIHGGDLFDRPDINISVVNRFIPILMNINVPFYIISGNHDIYGHNQHTLYRSMLGLMLELGVFKLLERDPIVIEKNHIKVQLTGSSFERGMDTDESRSAYILDERLPDVDYAIHVVHGFLSAKSLPSIIPHTTIDQIKNTKADITLGGHYHAGFPITKLGDKFYANPGGLVRIASHKIEMERTPKVLILELNEDIKINEVILNTAKPSELVLDRSVIEEKQMQLDRLDDFKNTVNQVMNFQKVDILSLLNEISLAEDIDENVVDEAFKRLSEILGSDLS